MAIEWLVLTGSLCLILALLEAWGLVMIFTQPDCALSKIIPGSMDLLKSHLDYLLMALFLFVFYLLFSHFLIKPASFLILSLIIGSLGNPALFLIRAIKPEFQAEPSPAFRLTMSASCI